MEKILESTDRLKLQGGGKLCIAGSYTAIGARAFENRVDIERVQILDSIESVGDGAFAGCGRLKEILLPKGLKRIGSRAFDGCSAMKRIAIPDTVEQIGDHALAGCVSLISVEFPEQLRRLGAWSFENFGSLIGVNLPACLHEIPERAFFGCGSLYQVTLPQNAPSGKKGDSGGIAIGRSAFERCRCLRCLRIGPAARRLDDRALAECSSLAELPAFADGAYLGDHVLAGCRACRTLAIPPSKQLRLAPEALADSFISELLVPNGVIKIDEVYLRAPRLKRFTVARGNRSRSAVEGLFCSKDGRVLYQCPPGLERLALPESIEKIAPGAFAGCVKLARLKIHDRVKELPPGVFAGCTALKSVELPETITEIPRRAFEGCASLREFVLPESITAIGPRAFAECTALKRIILPAAITEIATQTFADCAALQRIVIPPSVKRIAPGAFARCSALGRAAIPPGTDELAGGAFTACEQLKIIAPTDSPAWRYAEKKKIRREMVIR
ncbi:MAG: leucine-rich repeat domain-containing protein [Thermoguttaceae bacterium]|nr:leucine-rich repeat domain-containing protein [Thermoguttaceae bacterium]